MADQLEYSSSLFHDSISKLSMEEEILHKMILDRELACPGSASADELEKCYDSIVRTKKAVQSFQDDLEVTVEDLLKELFACLEQARSVSRQLGQTE